MNETLRERFDRNIKAKAGIGHPFTMEDVADSLGVPSRDLRSSWLMPFAKSDTIRNIGSEPTRNRKHQVKVWCGTYYLDLAAEEEAERLAQQYKEAQDAPVAMTEKNERLIADLLAS